MPRQRGGRSGRGRPPLTRRELTAYNLGRRVRAEAGPVADWPAPDLARLVVAATAAERAELLALGDAATMRAATRGWLDEGRAGR